MLQSPKPRIQQQQRRLAGAPKSPVLEAKQDPLRRIQQRPSSRQHAPNTIQCGTPRKQHHRRQLSVPDNVLMSIVSAPVQGGVHENYKFYQSTTGGSDMVDVGSDRRRQITNSITNGTNNDNSNSNSNSNNNNFFLQPLSPKSRTPSHQAETCKCPWSSRVASTH